MWHQLPVLIFLHLVPEATSYVWDGPLGGAVCDSCAVTIPSLTFPAGCHSSPFCLLGLFFTAELGEFE